MILTRDYIIDHCADLYEWRTIVYPTHGSVEIDAEGTTIYPSGVRMHHGRVDLFAAKSMRIIKDDRGAVNFSYHKIIEIV